MLAIPELLDRWILKNLANYPGVYYVTGGEKTHRRFVYYSDLWSQNQRFLENI